MTNENRVPPVEIVETEEKRDEITKTVCERKISDVICSLSRSPSVWPPLTLSFNSDRSIIKNRVAHNMNLIVQKRPFAISDNRLMRIWLFIAVNWMINVSSCNFISISINFHAKKQTDTAPHCTTIKMNTHFVPNVTRNEGEFFGMPNRALALDWMAEFIVLLMTLYTSGPRRCKIGSI